MHLPEILPDIGKTSISKHIKKTRLDGNNYRNERNSNKKLLDFLEDCFAYNIF